MSSHGNRGRGGTYHDEACYVFRSRVRRRRIDCNDNLWPRRAAPGSTNRAVADDDWAALAADGNGGLLPYLLMLALASEARGNSAPRWQGAISHGKHVRSRAIE